MGTDRAPYKREIENVTATEVVGPRRMESINESILKQWPNSFRASHNLYSGG